MAGVEGNSLSARIREVLTWPDEGQALSILNLSELKTRIEDSHKHNLIVKVIEFRRYEQGASQVGMSLSNYIISRLAHALNNNTNIDFELAPFFDGWADLDFSTNNYLARKQAPRYRVYKKGLDELEKLGLKRPFNSELVIRAINHYLEHCLSEDKSIEVNLSGVVFQSRHNEQVISLKIPLPVHYENILDELARRSLVSKSAVLIKILKFDKVYQNYVEQLQSAI